MRLAALGHGYAINVSIIHHDGETWPYERLVDFSFDGLFDWYARTLGLPKEQLGTLRDTIPELSILGAFFHRFKIVLENLNTMMGLLNGGVQALLPAYTTYKGFASFGAIHANLQTGKLVRRFPPHFRALFERVSHIESLDDFAARQLAIEMAVDRTQCVLFYILKYGSLPPNFRMDERVDTLAKTPIDANHGHELSQQPTNEMIQSMLRWMDVYDTLTTTLSTPLVTFGLF
jgi:hypothetical protein